MADPFVAEIRIFGFNFAPRGWARCDGQILPISQNTALFSLVGTIYGGDGKKTFALPNLQGSAPLGQGQGNGLSLRHIGESGGSPNVSLLLQEMPTHSHNVVADEDSSNSNNPSGTYFAVANGNAYGATVTGTMSANMVSQAGGGLPHNNLQPYLTLNFCIALQGIYPPSG